MASIPFGAALNPQPGPPTGGGPVRSVEHWPVVEGEWPLVGRTAELERVDGLLRRGAGGVVLAGPAGVGKTRLASECLGLAEQRGFAQVRVGATEAAAALPFGAFAPLLPDLAPGLGR